MNMEDQLDDMTVRLSEDATTIHSLQLQVETLEEGVCIHVCRRGQV